MKKVQQAQPEWCINPTFTTHCKFIPNKKSFAFMDLQFFPLFSAFRRR
jgi:hypothetical protein